MNAAGMICTVAAAIFLGVLWAYTGRVQCATLWAGRAIASAGFDVAMAKPTGYQDAITPAWQNRNNLICMIGIVALLIVGSLQAWYFGIVALVVVLVSRAIAEMGMPKQAAWYLHQLSITLANRQADYQRAGDFMRAEAAQEVNFKIMLLLQQAAATNQRLPSITEAKVTPTGQVDGWL